MAVAVVGGALLRVGEDAIGFGGFAEAMLGVGFVIRIAVGMIFQGGFAISALDLFGGGVARDAEDLVIIIFGCRRHCRGLVLRCGSGIHIRCSGGARGIRGDANHGRAQNLAVKNITGLQFLDDRVVRMGGGFDAFDGVMKMGVEGFAFSFDFFQAVPGKRIEKLLANELKTLAVFVVRGVAMRGDGAVESVEDGQQAFDDDFGAAMAFVAALAFDALAVILEVGLEANERVFQVGFFGGEFFEFVADDFFDGGAFENGGFVCAGVRRGVLRVFVRRFARGARIGAMGFFGIAVTAHDSFSVFISSEKNWDIRATTVMTRS